jgi:acyl carrier protein
MLDLTMDRVCQIVSDVMRVPVGQVAPETSPQEVESWDSLQHLNLVLALEQEFKISFTPKEMSQLVSPKTIISLLDKKTRTGALK